MFLHLSRKIGLLSLVVAFGACAPTVVNRGTFYEPEALSSIKVGESTREDVLNAIGSPTEVGTFNDKTWYYVGWTTEQVAFFDPKVIARHGAVISFNDEGVVSSLESIDAEKAKDIDPVGRKTPTYGREMTILEQLLGNIGRPGSMKNKDKKIGLP